MNKCFDCETCKSADKLLESYIAGLSMETSHHRVRDRVRNVVVGCRVSAAVSVLTVPAELRPKRPEGSAEQMRIPLWPEIF